MKIDIGNKQVEVKVIRKRRKTISIKISDNCNVVVTAPEFISDNEIMEILRKREVKIAEVLKHIKSKIQKAEGVKQEALYLGEIYKVNINYVKHNTLKLIFDKEKFNIYLPEIIKEEEKVNEVKELLIKWYKLQAKRIFYERVNYYSAILKVFPKRIAIKDQKTRWGSCSSKDNINLNYRLIMAPINIIEYVVVHELCHLIHLNHSKDFWSLVEKVLPDYKGSKEWLKVNGSNLKL